MAKRALRICAEPGCPVLIESGTYCDQHRREREREAKAEHEASRPSAARRGYGHRWRKLRKMVLARDPLCQDPYGIHEEQGQVVAATVADHIVPRSRGGRDTMDNLQGLCASCHNRKTAKEDGRWGD